MALQDQERLKIQVEPLLPAVAAKRYIHLLQKVKNPNEEQQVMLAAAHYTLSTERNVSCHLSKMHINSAIVLLKRIGLPNRDKHWSSQIAHAYFKRAELLEEKSTFIQASSDYLKIIEILEDSENSIAPIEDEDHVLLAQSAVSIADLILSEQLEEEKSQLAHPLFYVNKALEHLAKIDKTDDRVFSTHAYAHQIAGIALSPYHFYEAKEAFRISLLMAFKTDTTSLSPLLADIYTCLGLLFEERFYECPLEVLPNDFLDHSMIYFGIAELLSPQEFDGAEEGLSILESLFEMIYRVIDPYLSPLSFQVCCDLIDALVYIYMCFIDHSLQNKALETQLNQADILDTYAQHIYLLVLEAYHKRYPRTAFIEIIEPGTIDLTLKSGEILNFIQNTHSNNVHYLFT